MRARFWLWNLSKAIAVAACVGATMGMNASLEQQRQAATQAATILAEQDIVYGAPPSCPPPPPGFVLLSCGATR